LRVLRPRVQGLFVPKLPRNCMMPADPSQPPILPDEACRLAALRELSVLDTPAEPGLDVITRLAADRFDCAIALVSLVDSDRQWFKSRHGLEATQTPRATSFCAHAIAADGVMVVPGCHAGSALCRQPAGYRGAAYPFLCGRPAGDR
jgi:hypothetical protein